MLFHVSGMMKVWPSAVTPLPLGACTVSCAFVPPLINWLSFHPVALIIGGVNSLTVAFVRRREFFSGFPFQWIVWELWQRTLIWGTPFWQADVEQQQLLFDHSEMEKVLNRPNRLVAWQWIVIEADAWRGCRDNRSWLFPRALVQS